MSIQILDKELIKHEIQVRKTTPDEIFPEIFRFPISSPLEFELKKDPEPFGEKVIILIYRIRKQTSLYSAVYEFYKIGNE